MKRTWPVATTLTSITKMFASEVSKDVGSSYCSRIENLFAVKEINVFFGNNVFKFSNVLINYKVVVGLLRFVHTSQ